MRAWSRRTVRQTFFQLMECQSGEWPGAAPASVAACDISALPPESVGQGSLVTEDLREVCSLSGGVMWPCGFNSYPAGYRPAFAFSPILYPPPRRLLLRVAVPCGETTGLPRFTDVPEWGRSPLFAGGASSASGKWKVPEPGHMPFWPKRDSILRLFSLTAFITALPGLTYPPNPGSRPP